MYKWHTAPNGVLFFFSVTLFKIKDLCIETRGVQIYSWAEECDYNWGSEKITTSPVTLFKNQNSKKQKSKSTHIYSNLLILLKTCQNMVILWHFLLFVTLFSEKFFKCDFKIYSNLLVLLKNAGIMRLFRNTKSNKNTSIICKIHHKMV